MRLLALALGGAFTITLAALLHASEPSGCKPDERVFLACAVGKKTLSVCASPTLTADSGYLHYRFGITGKDPELEYPKQPMALKDAFAYSASGYAKGTTQELRFSMGDHTYTVHVDNHAFKPSAAGVIVERGGARIAYLKCNSFPWPNEFHALQRTGIPVGEPRYVGTPDP